MRPREGPESARRSRVALQRGRQPVRMRALQIPLDAFRTQHSFVERKVFPRFKPDDRVVFHLELNATLLAAKAAMRLDDLVRLNAGFQPHASAKRQMWAELVNDVAQLIWYGRHKKKCSVLRTED